MIKSALKKLLLVLSATQVDRFFDSYEEALAYCDKQSAKGYESDLLSRYRFEKLTNFQNSNGNLLASPSATILLYVLAVYLKGDNSKIPNFIDFGGACGESVLLLSSIFGGVYKKSWVVESTSMVEESRKWKSANSIMFSSSLETVMSQNHNDIFFSSGTIQYLPSPLAPLSLVAGLGVPLVALTRNNFSAKSKVVAQRSTLAMNGTGAHIKNYGNPAMYYPNTSIVKSELINIFSSNGYSVILDTSGTSSGVYGNDCYSGDLVFMKV